MAAPGAFPNRVLPAGCARMSSAVPQECGAGTGARSSESTGGTGPAARCARGRRLRRIRPSPRVRSNPPRGRPGRHPKSPAAVRASAPGSPDSGTGWQSSLIRAGMSLYVFDARAGQAALADRSLAQFLSPQHVADEVAKAVDDPAPPVPFHASQDVWVMADDQIASPRPMSVVRQLNIGRGGPIDELVAPMQRHHQDVAVGCAARERPRACPSGRPSAYRGGSVKYCRGLSE